MGSKNQYELCLKIAEKAHRGQKRKSGGPYIVHPKAVAKRFKTKDDLISILMVKSPHLLSPPVRDEAVRKAISGCAALLHDVLEDTKITAENLLSMGVHPEVVQVVKILSRNSGQPYVDYIKDIMYDESARDVKIADLEDNLKDLKSGNMKDKYELALYILKSVKYS